MILLRKKISALLITAAFIISLLPAFVSTSYAEPTLAVSLGGATLTGAQYNYGNATVTGGGIKTILISFTKTPASGDRIIAPTGTAGFTVSSSTINNSYAKRINIAYGKTSDEVQSYLRSILFEVASKDQSVSVSVTTENILYDTYYNSVNHHYYQFVPLDSAGETWITSYNIAKTMHYMGRTGYLATVTSVQEDQFMLSVSGNVGWLGGTRMTYNSTDGTFTSTTTTGYWYWACGPEFDLKSKDPSQAKFYNAQYADQTTPSNTDSANSSYYFNWNRGGGAAEPNGDGDAGENCLTTLFKGEGYKTYPLDHKNYSWNDVSFSSNYLSVPNEYNPKGYIVEYGNRVDGDSGTGDTDGSTYATATATLYETGNISLGTVTWTSATSYTCGITLPASAKMVSLSVDSGYFTIPSLGSALSFVGGTTGADYTTAHSPSTQYSSAVVTFSDVSAAAALLGNIAYSPSGTSSQVITAASSAVPVQGTDLYFGGHFYRYVSGMISWAAAVKNAGITDPYFGGRGYISTVTSNAENRVLLKLIEISSSSWHSAWLGGLWQRNPGSGITRGIDGGEYTYADISSAVNGSTVSTLLPKYNDSAFGFIAGTPSTYIYSNPSSVLYYWIDGPEAGQEIQNNTAAFSPWHSGEPNGGDFVYVGFEGAYWDDLADCADTRDGYIVEFSGFAGGSSAGIIKTASKTVSFTEIGPAAITGITSPVQLASPDTSASCVTTGVSSVSAVSWTPSVATAFGFGTAYTASVTLTAVNGYKFAASPTASVNGSAAVVSGVSAGQITVSYTFTATADLPGDSLGNIPVIIDGREFSIGTSKTETDAVSGRRTTVVTLDESAFRKQLESASESVIIPIPETVGISSQRSVLTADMVDRASAKNIPVEIRTDAVSYIISAGAVPTSELAASLGAPSDALDDIKIDINLTSCSAAQLGVVENADDAGTWSLLMPPSAFTVTVSYNGQTVDVELFDCYVERVLEIPDGVDPSRITTALVVTDSGATRHVPTDVYRGTDGKWYARISSVTNSVYALVYNETGFADAAGKWYEDAVSEMASRMVLNGRSASVFDGDSSITRAEFAAVLVRALGLPEDGKASFTDVSSSDWYYGAVGTAYKYKIISGRDGGVFDPNAAITREEAMVMIQRAASVAEYAGTGTGSSAAYTDLSKVSSWAVSAADFNLANGLIKGYGGLIRPSDDITRAEASTVVLRLLQKAGLVDIRTAT